MEPTVYNDLQRQVAQYFITFLKDKDSVKLAQSIMNLPQPMKFVGVTEIVSNLHSTTNDESDKLRSAVALILEDNKNQRDYNKLKVQHSMYYKFFEVIPIDGGHYQIGVDWNAVDDFLQSRKNFETINYN